MSGEMLNDGMLNIGCGLGERQLPLHCLRPDRRRCMPQAECAGELPINLSTALALEQLWLPNPCP